MSNYEIGYGRPPTATRFKPGVSGNPQGRPKRRPTDMAAVILDTLNAPILHHENGQERSTPGWELKLNILVRRALSGDVDAAISLLKFRIKAERNKSGTIQVVIEDWWPDYPGQTAEEKTREFARKRGAEAVKWWTEREVVKND